MLQRDRRRSQPNRDAFGTPKEFVRSRVQRHVLRLDRGIVDRRLGSGDGGRQVARELIVTNAKMR
jgi:hypothetical protein